MSAAGGDGGGFRGTVPALLADVRVDRAVAMLLGCSRARASALVERGGVRVDGRAVRTGGAPLRSGQELEVDDPGHDDALPAPEAEVVFAVVHEDPEIVVVDKPPGLVVHPGAGRPRGTLVGGLLARYPELAELARGGVGAPERPGIVHRLDRGTSGLLVVARTPAAYHELVRQLSERRVERRYLALVTGHVEAEQGVVDAPIGRSGRTPTRMAVSASGRPARTAYRVVRRFESPTAGTLVELSLETGRTHQIRVHLAAIGHPVVGDDTYGTPGGGSRPPAAPEGARLPDGAGLPGGTRLPDGTGLSGGTGLAPGRLFLHAHVLGLAHPSDGAPREWRSPLPPDLAALLDDAAG